MFSFNVYGLNTFTLHRFGFNSESDKTDVRVPSSVDGWIVRSLPRNNYVVQKSTETEVHVPRVRATKSVPNID